MRAHMHIRTNTYRDVTLYHCKLVQYIWTTQQSQTSFLSFVNSSLPLLFLAIQHRYKFCWLLSSVIHVNATFVLLKCHVHTFTSLALPSSLILSWYVNWTKNHKLLILLIRCWAGIDFFQHQLLWHLARSESDICPQEHLVRGTNMTVLVQMLQQIIQSNKKRIVLSLSC